MGEVERRPALASLDVGMAPSALGQMKMQEWLAAYVEHAGLFFDDPRPRAQLGEDAGEIVEQLGRTPHDGRHVRCTGLIAGVRTFSHRVCMTRSIVSSNMISAGSVM